MSIVYFSPLKSKHNSSPLLKLKKLFNRFDPKKIYKKDDIIGIKLHFGELGNAAFIRPIYLRPIIDVLKDIKAKPFLTDTNTLYIGMRTNSVDHIHNAMLNGFGYSTLQTPIIIADGLRGENYKEVNIPNGIKLKTASIASDILNADAIIVVSHFKGHDLTGFGGAIKNISMGCASRAGKLTMHSSSKPLINIDKCTACGRCASVCNSQAIVISKTTKITDKCIGCAACIAVCPHRAIHLADHNSNENLMELMAEYATAVLSNTKKTTIFINILTSISPACDCLSGNNSPLVGDIGFIASTDPVAIDKASYDLVIKANNGVDPFKVNGNKQLEHGEKIELGKQNYILKEI